MERRKISSDLYMAINIPENVRVNTLDLNVGFNDYFDEWELIIRYFGELSVISEEVPFAYIELLSGYAIIRIRQENIGRLSD